MKACPYLGWNAVVTRDAIDHSRIGNRGVVASGRYGVAGWSLTVEFEGERQIHYPFNHLELSPS